MDLAEIKELIDLAKASGIAELEVEHGSGEAKKRIRIVRATAAQVAPEQPAAPAAPAEEPRRETRGETIPAPLSGTFYRAPAPGEPPFVEVGGKVAVGDVLCIIESMKMMNKVKSDRAGEVVEVLLDDGQAIESGTGLFRIL